MSNENLSEKVSVNINSFTLSQIDLLVDNGYYSNRSDFINQALRESLRQQQSTLERVISQNTAAAQRKKEQWFIGIFNLTAADVEAFAKQGGGVIIAGYGMLVIDSEIEEEKLFSTVQAIRVKGKTACRNSIKERYGLK